MKTHGDISWCFSKATDEWYSRWKYWVCNLADHTWDDLKVVEKNRKAYAQNFWKKRSELVFMNQEHWNNIRYISNNSTDVKDLECDGIFTDQKWLALNVLVADCVPIVIFNPVIGLIWVVHAWWKPTSKKILQKMIAAFIVHWSRLDDIIIKMWPYIQQKSYEVDDAVVQFFPDIEYREIWNGKYMLDLWQANKNQALSLGILDKNIAISSIDTYTDVNYFSARRQWIDSWRFCGSIIIN